MNAFIGSGSSVGVVAPLQQTTSDLRPLTSQEVAQVVGGTLDNPTYEVSVNRVLDNPAH